MTDHLNAARDLFDADEVREVLQNSFYRPSDDAQVAPPVSLDARGRRRKKAPRAKADHYEILCISMYVEDLARLDEKVGLLKQRGHRRMTRSALIRYALDKLALEAFPPPAY